MNYIPDIPLPAMKPRLDPKNEDLRLHGDQYLGQVLEQHHLTSDKITRLEGGISSAVYLVKSSDQDRIVKFRRGVAAEAEALKAWKKQGVDVPEVFDQGILKTDARPAPYLIMEAVKDQSGQLAQGADRYANEHPETLAVLSQSLGKLMGQELARMHSVTVDKPVGGFADSDRDQSLTVRGYLEKMVSQNHDFVVNQLGISEEQLNQGLAKLAEIDFPDLGAYVHTDFGPHNILLKSIDPLKISIFDPNPLIGDPYLDLALKAFEIENHTQLAKINPTEVNIKRTAAVVNLNQAIINTYAGATGRKIDQQRLLANALFGYLAKLEFRYRRFQSGATNKGEFQINAQTAAYQTLFSKFLP